jgi:hypothetical protein
LDWAGYTFFSIEQAKEQEDASANHSDFGLAPTLIYFQQMYSLLTLVVVMVMLFVLFWFGLL